MRPGVPGHDCGLPWPPRGHAYLAQPLFAVDQGTTLSQLAQYADALNFSTRAVRLDIDELRELKAPSILHWNLNHFVVLGAFFAGLADVQSVGRERSAQVT